MTMYRPKVWRLPRNPMLGNSSAYYYLLIEESGLRGIIMLTWPNLALTWHSVSIFKHSNRSTLLTTICNNLTSGTLRCDWFLPRDLTSQAPVSYCTTRFGLFLRNADLPQFSFMKGGVLKLPQCSIIWPVPPQETSGSCMSESGHLVPFCNNFKSGIDSVEVCRLHFLFDLLKVNDLSK